MTCTEARRNEAMGATRMMPPSFAMGTAAGTAAVLVVRAEIQVRAVNVPGPQAAMAPHGAWLGEVLAASPARSAWRPGAVHDSTLGRHTSVIG